MARAILAALVLLHGSCREAQPPAPEEATQASSLPSISVTPTSKLLLTYFSLQESTFETVNAADKVPEHARSWVRIVDLSIKPERRMDHELVYVADMRKARADGSFGYIVMSRKAFEERARNLAPRGESGVAGGRDQTTGARVILYATAWCPACKAARQWLQQRKIPFVEKDIEKDASAAAELMHKAQRAGLSTNGVPVLDVRGTLVQGFDAKRVVALLAGGTSAAGSGKQGSR